MRSELLAYGENTYSQSGEDGILAEVSRRLGDDLPHTYVDIGAHDGRFMSNTERLRECGWTGLNIDSNPSRCKTLADNLARWPGNEWLCHEVAPDGIADLACWDVGLVDIDVDGPELQLWRALPGRPVLMLVEIDAADALGVLREHSAKQRLSSFSSMVAHGESVGYRLIAYTGLNCLFANAAVAEQILHPVPDADSLYLNGESRTYYRQLVKTRSDAAAKLRDWSRAYR